MGTGLGRPAGGRAAVKPEDVERIHEASLRILDEVGVRLEHDGIVERVLAAGARPGKGAHDVRLPPGMVREHLALAPRRVELAARDGTATVLGPESETVFWTTPVLYLWTGSERRPVTNADLLEVARLSDRLEAVQGELAALIALKRRFANLPERPPAVLRAPRTVVDAAAPAVSL